MIFVIILIAICIISSVATYKGTGNSRRYEAEANALAALILAMLISLVFLCMFWGASYSTYIEVNKIYYGTAAQYKGAIDVYEDRAVIDMIRLTDFGHQAYNEAMADLVKDLRRQVSRHNEIVIGKRVMGNSPFFSWLIIGKDLKLLEISEERKEATDEDSDIAPRGGGEDINRDNYSPRHHKYS